MIVLKFITCSPLNGCVHILMVPSDLDSLSVRGLCVACVWFAYESVLCVCVCVCMVSSYV